MNDRPTNPQTDKRVDSTKAFTNFTRAICQQLRVISNSQQQHQNSTHPQKQQSTPLAMGERIVWMADNGPEFGTVRWIGVLEDVSEDWTVGVEFDK